MPVPAENQYSWSLPVQMDDEQGTKPQPTYHLHVLDPQPNATNTMRKQALAALNPKPQHRPRMRPHPARARVAPVQRTLMSPCGCL